MWLVNRTFPIYKKAEGQQVGIPYHVQNESQQVDFLLADFKIPMNHNARSILFDTSETFGCCKDTGNLAIRKHFLHLTIG
jgi:hypothetical protein